MVSTFCVLLYDKFLIVTHPGAEASHRAQTRGPNTSDLHVLSIYSTYILGQDQTHSTFGVAVK